MALTFITFVKLFKKFESLLVCFITKTLEISAAIYESGFPLISKEFLAA